MAFAPDFLPESFVDPFDPGGSDLVRRNGHANLVRIVIHAEDIVFASGSIVDRRVLVDSLRVCVLHM